MRRERVIPDAAQPRSGIVWEVYAEDDPGSTLRVVRDDEEGLRRVVRGDEG